MSQGNTPDGYGEEPGYGPPGYGPPPGYPPPPGYAPQPGYGLPQGGPPPPSYLAWAIVSTILCCLPAGVVAIVFAAQVNGRWASGNAEGAWRASRNAKMWTIISAVVGVALAIVLILVGVFGSTHTTSTGG